MSISRRLTGPLCVAAVLAATACATPPRPATDRARPPPQLPPLPVEQVSDRGPPLDTRDPHDVRDPFSALPMGDDVSLTATAVDVATLLAALGDAVGISLVVDPGIQRRITVNFTATPAREALRAVLAEAGLFIAPGPPEPPYGAVVFYTLPVDIDAAGAETISARFGVSLEVAEFIVRSRVR